MKNGISKKHVVIGEQMNVEKIDKWFQNNLGLGMFVTGCVVTIALLIIIS